MHCTALIAVAAGLLIAVSSPVRADDLKLTGTLSIEAAQVSDASVGAGAAPGGAGEEFAVWSHGKQARLDITGGTSTLFDGDSGLVIVLDPAAKTYYKMPLKSWQPAPLPQMASAFAAQGDGSSKVSLNFSQTDATPGNTQSFGGHDARKYLIGGMVRAGRSDGYGGHRDGGVGGGGWGGGGGGGRYRRGGNGGGAGGSRRSGRTTQTGGDVWLGGGSGFVDDKGSGNPLWAEALVSAWSVGPLTGALAAKIQESGRLPWQAHLTTTWSQFSGALLNGDSVNGGNEISNSDSISTVVTLTTISNVELPASLFMVPSSYTQVSPPVTISGD